MANGSKNEDIDPKFNPNNYQQCLAALEATTAGGNVPGRNLCRAAAKLAQKFKSKQFRDDPHLPQTGPKDRPAAALFLHRFVAAIEGSPTTDQAVVLLAIGDLTEDEGRDLDDLPTIARTRISRFLVTADPDVQRQLGKALCHPPASGELTNILRNWFRQLPRERAIDLMLCQVSDTRKEPMVTLLRQLEEPIAESLREVVVTGSAEKQLAAARVLVALEATPSPDLIGILQAHPSDTVRRFAATLPQSPTRYVIASLVSDLNNPDDTVAKEAFDKLCELRSNKTDRDVEAVAPSLVVFAKTRLANAWQRESAVLDLDEFRHPSVVDWFLDLAQDLSSGVMHQALSALIRRGHRVALQQVHDWFWSQDREEILAAAQAVCMAESAVRGCFPRPFVIECVLRILADKVPPPTGLSRSVMSDVRIIKALVRAFVEDRAAPKATADALGSTGEKAVLHFLLPKVSCFGHGDPGVHVGMAVDRIRRVNLVNNPVTREVAAVWMEEWEKRCGPFLSPS